MACHPNEELGKHCLFLHTVPFLGVQICWTIQQVFGMIYLASLGIPDRVLPILIASGPWSGLLVPPIAAIISGRYQVKSWRLVIFSSGVGVTTSLLCLASAGSLYQHNAALSQIVAGIAICTINISMQPLQIALRASVVDNFSPAQQPMANLWTSRFAALGSVLVTLVGHTSNASFPETACVSSAILAFVLLLNLFSVNASGSPGMMGDSPRTSYQPRTASSMLASIGELPPLTRRTCRIQLASWFSWFFILNYTSSLLDQTFASDSPSDNRGAISSTPLLFHLTGLGTTLAATMLWGRDKTDSQECRPLCLSESQAPIPQPLSRLMTTWRLCLLTLSIWLLGVFLTVSSRPEAAMLLLSAIGSIFALTNWIPYALIAYEVSTMQRNQGQSSTAMLLAAHNAAICLPQILASGVGWILATVVESLGYPFHVSLVFLACIPACLLAAYLV